MIDSGETWCQAGQTDFEQVAILRWDPATAQKRMEDILTSTYASEKVAGRALAVRRPVARHHRRAQGNGYGTAGSLPVVTGQDAEVQSVKSIIADEQYSTIFKDTRELAKVTVDMVKAIAHGEEPEVNNTETYDNGVKVVPSYLLDPVIGDKDNVPRCWSTPATTPRTRSSRNPFGGARATPGPRPSGRSASHGPRESDAMADAILEMRDITKKFPGVTALSDVNLVVRRSEIHAICGENGAGKSTLMKVLSGVHPHGSYEGEIVFEGKPVRVLQHPAERSRRHRDHPPGARAHPRAVDRREHLPGQRDGHWRRHQLGRGQPPGDRAARPGRSAGEPADPGQAPRHRQAAAGRDREGAEQGGRAPHPRRADRRAERRRLPAPARPAQGPAGQGHHLGSYQPQAQRDRAGRRRDHHHPRRQDDRDPGRRRGRRRRGPHHPRDGRSRPRAPVPRPHTRHRRGDASRSGTGR